MESKQIYKGDKPAGLKCVDCVERETCRESDINVKVKRESKTLATITFQNFFNKFDKKAGMTGTALTEEKEFRDIYGMDVIEIPTNRPVARIDLQDAVYKSRREKLNAIVDAVEEANKKGQPVLVGTITIEKSELLSKMLRVIQTTSTVSSTETVSLSRIGTRLVLCLLTHQQMVSLRT